MSDAREILLPVELVDLARRVIEQNRAHGRKIAVAESCTGGLVSAALTEIAGSSDVFEAVFVTYSNEAKATVLGVSDEVIETFGSVSVAAAWAMAQGAIDRGGADVAVAITGIAGPAGGSAMKPLGTGEHDGADRLPLRSAAGPGDAGDRHRHVGPAALERAPRHRPGGRHRDAAERLDDVAADAEEFHLRFVRIGDEAGIEDVRAAGDLGQGGSYETAGAALRDRDPATGAAIGLDNPAGQVVELVGEQEVAAFSHFGPTDLEPPAAVRAAMPESARARGSMRSKARIIGPPG